MGWSKGQIVAEAYGELALASYEFDLSPDEVQAAVRRLDTMMATWHARGVTLGYSVATTPENADPDDDSGLPLDAVEAVYLALAIRIAASKGKAIAQTTSKSAKDAFDALVSRIASQQMQEQQFPQGTPRGAGRKPLRGSSQPFLYSPDTTPLQNNADGGLNFTGKSN